MYHVTYPGNIVAHGRANAAVSEERLQESDGCGRIRHVADVWILEAREEEEEEKEEEEEEEEEEKEEGEEEEEEDGRGEKM